MQCWWLQPNLSPRTWQTLWHTQLPSTPRALPSAGQPCLTPEKNYTQKKCVRHHGGSVSARLCTTRTALQQQYPRLPPGVQDYGYDAQWCRLVSHTSKGRHAQTPHSTSPTRHHFVTNMHLKVMQPVSLPEGFWHTTRHSFDRLCSFYTML